MPIAKFAGLLALKLIAAATLSATSLFGFALLNDYTGWISNEAIRPYFDPNWLIVGILVPALGVCAYVLRVRGLLVISFVLVGLLFAIPLYLLVAFAYYQPN